jgi:hypothetical protein
VRLRALVGVQRRVRGWGHAVEEAEDLQLRLEFVGDEVDGDVGIVDGVFYRGGEAQGAGSACGQLGIFILSAPQFVRHDVFEHDIETGDRAAQREGAACGPGSNDGDLHLLGFEGGDDGLVAGFGLTDVVSDAGLFFFGEAGQHGEDAAQGDRDVIDVVHGANCFSRKWQRVSPLSLSG